MPIIAVAGLLYGFGAAFGGGVHGGVSCVLWGIFLRTTLGLHFTWLVNSATHVWGSRRFVTRDTSTNNFVVAMLTFGEGWHNNHHAHPTSGAARVALVAKWT